MFSALIFLSAQIAVTPVFDPKVEPNPKVMTQKEIRAHNAHFDRKHPFYIRCVSTVEIGTLSKRNYSCRTNRQWELSDRVGNDNARETYDSMTSKSWNQSG
ncbi:MAG: hypothetical protein ACKOPQ_09185 [Novosphingobium sp.]|jgi:hypothetical protein